ncbi:MAG: tatA [Sphingobacteriales bacterium]|nr:tatA [Sphingobacteriales bacterium]
MGGLGTPELLIILVAVMLLFGGKKLPELMRGLGKGVKDFKNAKDGILKPTSVTDIPKESQA